VPARPEPPGVAPVAPAAGLTEHQAAERLAEHGRNDLDGGRHHPLRDAVVHQLTDTVVVVLLLAAVLTAAVGDATDTAVILAVIVLNTALGVGQELRSGRALAALAAMTAPHATVVRAGVARDVDAAEVVPDDLLRVAAGDIVAADAVVGSAEALQADESMLTGESVPVSKRSGDPVFAGTVVVRGHADATVTATGRRTRMGGIAHTLGEAGVVATPIQRQLAVLGRRLAVAVAVAAVVVGGLDLLNGRSLEASVVLAISLAVAAIPESLPAVVSLALAMAAHRMSGRGVLVRRMAAVEAIGSITVLASDKTGTLTEGRMSVAEVWTPDGTADARRRLLHAGVLCNDACLGADTAPAPRDDPIEVALVEAATRDGIDVPALRAAWIRVAEEPFDAALARMTTSHRAPDRSLVEIRKGSPEALLPDLPGAAAAADAAQAFARDGYRVLAVTTSAGDGRHIAGLVAFRDPARSDAGAFVNAFRTAGVRPIMITGDHQDTARAIAGAVHIEPDDVFARVHPEEKLAIVTGLQGQGEIVAMTGDGVNDAPALHGSDVGVSMGARATEVARQAADIVLTTDDLSALIPAIGEGRRAFDNLRRYLHYALGGGLAEVLIMVIGPLLGFAVPLQAGQILWVNLLTHGLPGVAIGNEPAADDVLRRPPRPPREPLLDRSTARRVAVLGAVIAASCLAVGEWGRYTDRPAQSLVFVTLTFAQLAAALLLRPRGTAVRANPMLPAAVALNVMLVILAVAWSPLRELLHTAPLTLTEFAVALLAAGPAAAAAFAQARSPRA
jgi:Ca2+-transporting ATPase